MTQYVVPVIIAVIGSSALWQAVVFFVERFDKKKKSNEDIVKEVQKVQASVDDLAVKVDENQAILARTHILRFSDELRNGIHHSDEYFRQQLRDCDTYERFCKDHPDFENSYTMMANKHIKETYKRLIEEQKL